MIMTPWQRLWCHDNDYDIMAIIMTSWHHNNDYDFMTTMIMISWRDEYDVMTTMNMTTMIIMSWRQWLWRHDDKIMTS